MREAQDTEIMLGTGRLLVLFFGLVVVCAVFFGLGFTLGRSSPHGVAEAAVAPASAPAPAVVAGGKPAATRSAAEPSSECATAPCEKPSTSDELAFYRNAPEKPAEAASAAASAVSPPKPAERETPRPAASSATPVSGFVVQIAAVTKRDDADALAAALRKKNYPVFTVPDSNDRLFHVQVGPFPDRKDAAAMKDRLAGDGYNAIVK
ncbi:MAG TPA: SPOR domain-containing protein [Terriglobales bacterium]|nr:SPOR domain-containing protein [Terriglobales bacterium]